MTPKIAMFTAIGAVAAVFLICMLINIIIGVRTVEVIGNDLASDEEIISVAGIETGSGYFSYNTGKSERAVLENIHCISEINVSRSLFGRVTVTVTEKKACWYTEVYGVYYALTRELEVIRKLDIRDDYVNRGLVRLDFPSVDEAVLGKTLKYSDSGRDCSFVPAFLDEILNSDLYKEGRLNQVKMETKFEIFAVCDMKYKINLGKYSGAAMKLSSVRLVIEQIDDDQPHEIEASDVGNIAERENRELDFSYLMPMLGG